MSFYRSGRVCSPAIVAAAALALGLATGSPVSAAGGAFDDYCAMGLASKQQVKTDCSINWIGPDNKLYCFSTNNSKEAFLKNPDGNISKAAAYFETKQAAKNQNLHQTAMVTAKEFTEEDVNKAVEKTLEARSKDGAFQYHDSRTNQELELVYEKTRIVRGMEGYGWFANLIFHDKENEKKQYALDFWYREDGDKLDLKDIRVQKGPKKEGDGWIMVTRLPVAWWWLPVSEHPGETEVTRGWHVMSAIHNYIADNKDKDGALVIEDEKTGQSISLEFIEIHQPVRRLKGDGEFFVCTDFRKMGSRDAYYDVDFWLDESSGKLKVTDVKLHKVPVKEDGIWMQEFRYKFEDLEHEDVH
ncbi:hypothetical protein [Methyloligella solikamskensis]|uniref:Uncharacterized protein n=1 Tax=Methyloligella solikamskensis TaxID=1177756 RepID=A0ABW3JCU4_9HYPH